MKLLICSFYCLFSLLLSISTVEARIPYSFLNIGGLTLDQQINSAYYVYGRPTDTLIVKSYNGFSIYEATYNSELMIYYVYGGYSENGRIRAVLCAEDNISTSLGIRVGMNQNDVLFAYGLPDKTYDEPDGGTTWCYLSDSIDHPNMPLYFFFDQNNVIYTIVIGDISYYN